MTDHDEPPLKRQRIDTFDGAQDFVPIAVESKTSEQEQLEKELEVGISEVVSVGYTGFTGVLKQRYTDFLVNEILPSGEVVHLINLEPPRKRDLFAKAHQSLDHTVGGVAEENGIEGSDKADAGGENTDERKQEPAAQSADVTNGVTSSSPDITDEQRNTLATIFGEELVVPLLALSKAVLEHPKWKPGDFKPVFTRPITDRTLRTEAHRAIREIFNSRFESETSAEDGIIKITPVPKRVQQRGGNFQHGGIKVKGKQGWDDLGGEHVHFTIYKENKDTMEAVAFLATQLKVAPKSFSFSGTKDRRAVTVQRASAYRVHAEAIAAVGRRLRGGTKLGDFEYRPRGLELGELGGNEFVISLRDCHFPGEDLGGSLDMRMELARSVVGASCAAFESRGFLNYYGLQRFGSFSTGTADVGTKLLQGEYHAAIRDILHFLPASLDPPPGVTVSTDDRNRAEALNIWLLEKDTGKTMAKLPRKFSAERNIVQYLGYQDRRQNNRRTREHDWQGALQTIPRNLRLMYVHAYQSLVWNAVAGERWRTFGDKVVAGDLVLTHEHADKLGASSSGADAVVDDADEPIVRPAVEDSAIEPDDFVRARPLSEREAASGSYSIFDVVLPLPGFDVVYPPNPIGDFYKQFMGSERGGGLDPHDMRRKWRDVSLSGSYRKLLARPGGPVGWELKAYVSDEEQLVETDADRLQKQGKIKGRAERGPPVVIQAEEESGEPEGGGDGDGDGDGGGEGMEVEGAPAAGSAEPGPAAGGIADSLKKVAVVLRFQLGPSTYATMALRELMGSGGMKTYKPDYGGGR